MNYQDNLSCSWLIGVDDSVKNVILSFLRFEVGAGDELKVYNGTNAAAPLLGTYSGSTLPPAISSTGAHMFITFTTNGTNTANGWEVAYNCIYNSFCSGTAILSDLSGEFTDGSDRFQYRNNNLCKWKIIPECFDIASTSLVFDEIHTEQDVDKIMIYDLANGTLLGSFSGDHNSPTAPLISPSGKFFVIFSTNTTVRGQGWRAHYETDCLNVGIGENKTQVLRVFPNPSAGEVFITFSQEQAGTATLKIYSAQGKLVQQRIMNNMAGKTATVDVSGWKKGIYLLTITTDKEQFRTKLVVE